jgi:hypothetical protein
VVEFGAGPAECADADADADANANALVVDWAVLPVSRHAAVANARSTATAAVTDEVAMSRQIPCGCATVTGHTTGNHRRR